MRACELIASSFCRMFVVSFVSPMLVSMSAIEPSAFGRALTFLERLDRANVRYQLAHVRDALMVHLATPGERWEVEFFEDGHVEVERFRSPGEIEGEGGLERLFSEATES